MAPPCITCKPEVSRRHGPVLDVYYRCSDDMAYTEGLPVGIPGPAIETAMRICGVEPENWQDIFDLVKLIGRTIANEVVAEHQRKQDEQQ